MAAKLTPKMRALKLLVISLGVLLLAGIGVLAAVVVWRINHSATLSATKPTASATEKIALPAGAKVVAADVDSGRLVVRIDLPNGGARVLIFDLASGVPITTIELVPTSP